MFIFLVRFFPIGILDKVFFVLYLYLRYQDDINISVKKDWNLIIIHWLKLRPDYGWNEGIKREIERDPSLAIIIWLTDRLDWLIIVWTWPVIGYFIPIRDRGKEKPNHSLFLFLILMLSFPSSSSTWRRRTRIKLMNEEKFPCNEKMIRRSSTPKRGTSPFRENVQTKKRT